MSRYIVLSLFIFCLVVTAFPVYAQQEAAGEGVEAMPIIQEGVVIEEGYAYATAPKQKNGAAFFIVSNYTDQHDRLIGVSSNVADKTVLHTMSENKAGVMEMQEVDGIDIPLGNRIGFTSAGDHVMLMGLNSPLKDGEKFTLTLTFEKAGEIKTEIPVKAPYVSPSVSDVETQSEAEEGMTTTTVPVEAGELTVAEPEEVQAIEPVMESEQPVEKPVEKKKGWIGKLLGK